MATTQPFIEGFGGMTLGAASSVLAAQLGARSMNPLDSATTLTALDNRRFLYIPSDFTLFSRPDTSATGLWVGFRLSTLEAPFSARMVQIRKPSLGIYLGIRLTADGILSYGYNAVPSITLGEGFLSTVFVEVNILGTTVNIFVNGAATAAYTGTVAAGPWTDFRNSRHPVGDIYWWEERLGEGTARVLPATLSVSGGTAGGAAASVADGLASMDDRTKYAVFSPAQKATLSLGDIVDNPVAIKAVSITAVGRKSGTALLPELLTTTTASTQTVGSEALGIGFGSSRTGIATDPHDSTPWTKAKINALLVGVGSA